MAERDSSRPTQRHRGVAVTTPLGEDVLLLRRMTGSETLSRPFELTLSLYSERVNLRFEDILGQSVTVRLDLLSGGQRYFNGLVSHFSQSPGDGRYAHYRATLRPWFWFLTRTADCRIYQNKTVPDIIRDVFGRHEFAEFEDSLSGSYRTWEYCVQYRETDFNFVSRLMEQEGIYYYFRHAEGRHTLVLCDSIGAHDVVEGYETIPYYPPDEQRRHQREHVLDWQLTCQVQPGSYELNDFDFARPRANLRASSSAPREHQHGSLAVYDYPGEYTQSQDGDAYARVRLEELHAEYQRAYGSGNAAGLTTGALFTLEDFPREDQNREYLILGTDYDIASDEYQSRMGLAAEARDPFTCTFTAMDRRVQFRPSRLTPKPLVQGPQTAIVVGPSGDEIHTDQYGRVKVHFHWDRHDDSDEHSSCWIRVSHPWAGKTWGAVAIPRIGQEVIVDFLEGDPDQPIITGRAYNAEQMPPYTLPDNATQSGTKSRSSKGGDPATFNELRFEDKKGQEEVYFHAEKDFNRVVENNDTLKVGFEKKSAGNQTIEIHNDQSETIGNNQTVTLKKGNRNVTVEMGNDSLRLKMGNRSVKLDLGKVSEEALQSIEFKVGQSSVKIDQMGVTVKGMMIKIEGTVMTEVKGMMTKVDGSAMLVLKGGITMIG
ncbi:MAG: type VI secretion system tip protein VgrG [Gammaproteobacteria bacterium]|nr:type VI secretion system tip protein VgrG [Gammaproteobacteria bacterium]